MVVVAILTICGLPDARRAELQAGLSAPSATSDVRCLFAGHQSGQQIEHGAFVLALEIPSIHDVKSAMTDLGIAETETGLTVQVVETIQLDSQQNRQLLFP